MKMSWMQRQFLWGLLLYLLTLVTVISGADDAQVSDIAFVNFSSQTVELFWYNGDTGGFEAVSLLEPFGIARMDSYKGHSFAYSLSNHPEHIIYNVKEDRDIHPIGLHDNSPQVHVVCSTTQGDLRITVEPTWSPLGAARFLELVTVRYLDGCALHRVVPGFLTQFGIGANYDQRSQYQGHNIPDDYDPHGVAFHPGYMAFAGHGKDSRTTEMFIVMPNTTKQQLKGFGTNPWETPFAHVDPEDLETVATNWYSYGDMPPWGTGPDPQQMYKPDGYECLHERFPALDYIETCRIVTHHDEEVVEEL